jgi:GMP synthase (glutamine-hydrolysing)
MPDREIEYLKKILTIQNISCETLGTLEHLLRKDGFDIEKVNAQEGGIPSKSTDYSAIIILGGPMAVYDDFHYLQKEQHLIKDAIKNNVAVLGVCLGSQLIAQAAGGRVYKARKKEIGWYGVSISQQGKESLFSGIKETKMRVFQWHGDTYEVPTYATILAYSDLYPQAFKIGSAFGIQFHLEVDSHLIKSWMKEYANEITAENLDPKNILPAPSDLSNLQNKCQVAYRNFTAMLR